MFKRALLLTYCLPFSLSAWPSTEQKDNETCLIGSRPPMTCDAQEAPASEGSRYYYVAATAPFAIGVLTNFALTRMMRKESLAYELTNKAMVPINTALALPLIGPFGSRVQQWCFWMLNRLNADPREKGRDILDTRWHDTQATYTTNAQASRNVYASITGRISTNSNRAKNALSSGDQAYAVDQISEAAVSMRFLFAEIKPDDHIVSMTMHVQFTNHVKLPRDFRARVLAMIAKYDNEFSRNPDVQHYYNAVLNNWLN